MNGRRRSADWAAWALFASLLVGVAAEYLTPPSIPLSGFLLIPVLASIALGRPVLTAALCVTSLALAIPVQLLQAHNHTLITVRSVLIGTSGLVAIGLAANLARIQRARAASEARYRLLAENTSDLVAQVRDGRFVWVSPTAEQVLGKPASYWVGRQLQEFIQPDDDRAFTARLAALADGDATLNERVRLVSVTGLTHWVDLHAAPFLDANGQTAGITLALRIVDDEVAAQREADEARRERERADALYRRSMDSAAVGMCLASPEGTFYQVNQAMCDFFGYDAETLMSKNWIELTHPDSRQADLDKVADMVTGRIESYRMTKKFVHADGHPIWGDLSVGCLRRADGSVEMTIGQIVDITKEITNQERLAEREAQNRALTKQLTAEMTSAAEYVKSILPEDLHGDVEVTSRYLPALELGGDGFHYRWLDDDHFKVYLLDVSGHGIRPALLSASVHNLIRSGSLPVSTLLHPDQVLNQLNALFQMEEQGETYFTIWYGVYQASTRTLRYASAGHPPALALTRDGGTVSVTPLSTPSAPIGMFDDTTYTATSYPVPPGGQLLIYSDGAYEISDDAKKKYLMSDNDFTSLCATLAAHRDWSLDTLIDHLKVISPHQAFDDDCALVLVTFP